MPGRRRYSNSESQNKGKYATLVEDIIAAEIWYPKPFIGARGFVALSTQHFLKAIGLSRRSQASLLKTIATVAAKCSYEIYLQHSNLTWNSKRGLLLLSSVVKV